MKRTPTQDREPRFTPLTPALPGLEYDCHLEAQSGDVVLNLSYCGQDADALARASAFLDQLSKRFRAAANPHPS